MKRLPIILLYFICLNHVNGNSDFRSYSDFYPGLEDVFVKSSGEMENVEFPEPKRKFPKFLLPSHIQLSVLKPFHEISKPRITEFGAGLGVFYNRKRGRILDIYSGISCLFINEYLDEYRYFRFMGHRPGIYRYYGNVWFQLLTVQLPVFFSFNISNDYDISLDIGPVLNANMVWAKGVRQGLVNGTFQEISDVRENVRPLHTRFLQMGIYAGFSSKLNEIYTLKVAYHTCMRSLFFVEYTTDHQSMLETSSNTRNTFLMLGIIRNFK